MEIALLTINLLTCDTFVEIFSPLSLNISVLAKVIVRLIFFPTFVQKL